MAATGYTPIYLYYSSTTSNTPSAGNLGYGELAINITDKNLFFKDNTNAVNTVPIRQSSASSNGWLSSTDWSTFNGKQAALVSGTNIKTVGGVSLLGSGDVGTIGVGYGGTGTSTAFTAGSVLFAGASGVYSQSNANFFWDNSNNRLGLGTASPTRQLHMNSSATASGIFIVNAAQTSGVDVELNSVDFRFQVRNNIPTVFLNNNAETFRIAAGGNVTAVGNFVVGTSGKGIDFSATAGTGTSELLADYEEGTWTPTVTCGSGTITSYTLNSAVYTKVGRQVTACVNLTITDAGTGGGQLLITPPFTPTYASGGGGVERNATGKSVWTYCNAGENYIRCMFYDNTTVVVTNRQPIISLTYFV